MNLQTKGVEKELKLFKGRFDEHGSQLFHRLLSYGIPHDEFLRGVREASENGTIYAHSGHRVSCLPCISCPARRQCRKYGSTCDRIVLREETSRKKKERCTTCSKRYDNYKRSRSIPGKMKSGRKLKPLLPE